ncbi:hypothetical protein [Paractinoplanes atraurantiacus]|uniref:Uncharacterized protein n=1 Tax=Paractinoplanes atraurantiacus TaxID=1036182 RepID=A0A285HX46_9ACTN|nr:hypothetical protein [Actinoplanes atraurantiacus]SNY40259.1 hypothetical protein SAMN05421748_10613 [Actinoplanes atraurantiacus]
MSDRPTEIPDGHSTTLDEHRTAIWSAAIGGTTVVAAAIVAGLLGWGPGFWTDLFDPGPRVERRTLAVTLPNDGKLPPTDVDITVPDAKPKSGESLWVAVRNLKDTTWYLHPCTADSAGRGLCSDVTVGATVISPGPWTISAIIVNDSGHEKILKAQSKYTGSLEDWLDDDLTAIGAASGRRETNAG